MIFDNLLEIETHAHVDGFYILKRKDTGQEVCRKDFELLEKISIEGHNISMPPKDTNAVLFLEYKISENASIREGAYYVAIKKMVDDDIRTFCNGKIFGKQEWIKDIKLNCLIALNTQDNVKYKTLPK